MFLLKLTGIPNPLVAVSKRGGGIDWLN